MTARFIVASGRKQPEAILRKRRDSYLDGAAQPGFRAFGAGVTPAYRFNSDDGLRHAPAFLADVPDTATKLAWLKAELARDLDVFARNPRRLLDLYFDFIRTRLDEEADALAERLAPLGGLFHVEDWAFSALRPMLSATIFSADIPDTDSVLVHDMAFWTGEHLLAVRLRGGATPSRTEAETCARLEGLGVTIVALPVRDMAEGAGIFAVDRFPAAFRSFWQNERCPCSPFRPQGLSADLAAI